MTLGPPASRTASHPETPAGAILHDLGTGVRPGQKASEVGKLVLDTLGLAEFKTEFAAAIRIHEIVAGVVDHLDLDVPDRAVTNSRDRRTQIDLDGHDADGSAVGRRDRRGGSKGRHVRRFDDAGLPVQPDLGDEDAAGGQSEGLAEIVAVAFAPQFVLRRHPDSSARPGAVDTEEFTPAIVGGDDAELQIIRLAGELGGETNPEPPAPLGHQIVRGRTVIEVGHHQILRADRSLEPDRVASRLAQRGFQYPCGEARVGFHPVQCARQDHRYDVAIGQEAEGGRGQQHQRDHGQCQPCRKFHSTAFWREVNIPGMFNNSATEIRGRDGSVVAAVPPSIRIDAANRPIRNLFVRRMPGKTWLSSRGGDRGAGRFRRRPRPAPGTTAA
jgi:hypothetical protein